MSFVSPDCDDIVGKSVICLPTYGWGWSRSDTKQSADFDLIARAGAFAIRVDGFFYFQGRRNGMFGKISSPDHLFSGLLFEATLMHQGEFNLTDRLCRRADLEIGPKYPLERGMAMLEGSPIYHGSSIIARDLESLCKNELARRIFTSYKNIDGANNPADPEGYDG